ncbi:MAG: chemotaxis response regulator protein-glutamate methylesterase [Alphaproteobacteria bacterium]|nr:chemotaxis response regulator protein-glutamate methylesterase [Alphaproteobacteria bacterium]
MPIRVLIVDDSAVIRGLMNKALAADSSIMVVGSASNGQMAISLAADLRPDVMVLDIEMPVMDGITALPEIIRVSPATKVIIASTLSLRNAEISMRALSLGATDYLPKPTARLGGEVDNFYRDLIAKVKALAPSPSGTAIQSQTAATLQFAATPAVASPAAAAPTPARPVSMVVNSSPLHVTGVKALAIASSTGGPQALMKLFGDIKGRLTNIPIFITQHMPPTFTTILAGHITKAGGRECREAQEGMQAVPGEAYIAPGDYHLIPEKTAAGQVVLHTTQDAPENFCRPAADPMLRALSSIYGRQLVIVVLTGMGSDGAEGAKIAAANGASVIAQDEASCVVYGMPRAVAEAGICRAVLPLADIGAYLTREIEGR